MRRARRSSSSIWLASVACSAASRPERRSASSISPRSAASGVRSSWASAALNWRISPTECSSRASVSLNAVATSSSSSCTPRVGTRRSSVRTSISRAALARAVSGRSAKPAQPPRGERGRYEQRGRQQPQQQIAIAAQRGVHRVERHADLQQILASTPIADRAVGDAHASVPCGHVERLQMRAIGADLLRREVQPQRRKAVGLHQQAAGPDVVDVHVARRFVDERRLIAVGAVVFDGGQLGLESQVAVEAVGQLLSRTVTSASSCRPSTRTRRRSAR